MDELDEIKDRLKELLSNIEEMSYDRIAHTKRMAPKIIHDALAAKFTEVSRKSNLPVSEDIEKRNILTAIDVIKELFPESPKITITYQRPIIE